MKQEMSSLEAAAVGLTAGLFAAFAMDRFQEVLAKASLAPDSGEPATDEAAAKIALATGSEITPGSKPLAGHAIHYLFGATLGVAYALSAERQPGITVGHGAAFGLGAAALFDEAGVPLAGLGKPPWTTPLPTHLYTAASHIVFGITLETVRRALSRTIR